MANLVHLIFSNFASISPRVSVTCHLDDYLYQLGDIKNKQQKRQLSRHFHSLPHRSFSLYTQLLPSQPDPSILKRFILFVPFKTSMTMALEPVISPSRRLLFPFCQITIFYLHSKLDHLCKNTFFFFFGLAQVYWLCFSGLEVHKHVLLNLATRGTHWN